MAVIIRCAGVAASGLTTMAAQLALLNSVDRLVLVVSDDFDFGAKCFRQASHAPPDSFKGTNIWTIMMPINSPPAAVEEMLDRLCDPGSLIIADGQRAVDCVEIWAAKTGSTARRAYFTPIGGTHVDGRFAGSTYCAKHDPYNGR